MKIRNVAIIAHVDHGKTTLVDALLRQSKTVLGRELAGTDLIMDSNELERERGITIFSKNAAIVWGDVKINIIDTPGHADFGGEVERVLKMADGCLLLVDAKEGPMPQTRFVLKKALEMGHRIIVVINKVDMPDVRPGFVLDKTFDLFVELGANDKTLNFPILYASAKHGKAGPAPELEKMTDITPLFEAIVKYIPSPESSEEKPLQFLATNITFDSFKGRIAIGRIYNGRMKAGQKVTHINRAGEMKEKQVVSLMTFFGLSRVEVKEVSAGDIVAVSGIPDINIGETIADLEHPDALPLLNIEEPTVKMVFMVNDSPFAGREGEFSTSRQIQERLYRELETDMALRVENNDAGSWTISGRGELHLAILIERIRREGYEFQVSRPQVIDKIIGGRTCTPYERVYIEVPEEHSGIVIQAMGGRKGELVEMRRLENIVHMEFIIPTRCLFGYRSEFLTSTRGFGIINTEFHKYKPDPGNWKERDRGSLVAYETGLTCMYGLVGVQDRGMLFVKPGVEVYEGQVVGQNTRQEDMRVNVCKEKHLSNMRSKGEGGIEQFNKYREMDLEDALEYISDDELVEVTPRNVRIRKVLLSEKAQKRKLKGLPEV
ncbi:translational GTPase TypA [Candidatus Desantisbacteria bacterium CG_4_10_14_0_8_um_filter_48_22]|uniref:50S ribosomal subunit assembly factor BipA n=1 Tax=Candidatus Desantisbacteria bacterium CG_4_10_14_0_8_um_filter_48_22 TaxID=1974543 RepID=A0A2M7S4S6_9BACT|nr:MAG: GTP-binding protein TypA [Candidatus Desantisbacteria bacterium CG1_02_49_89]PIV54347.1 MAG: translational GTPase TypA [Candidatus Desantisbacteria bacterium CG02_land_8_20_14_3_00_49_13]PIZ14571.1 MAG: translational GTPase TypA [Candidatus Desantisbacteria bacterium CG_4_10_14_0_8_um_filter_48_22]